MQAPARMFSVEHELMERRANAKGMPTQTPSNWSWYVKSQVSAQLPTDILGGLRGGGKVTRLGAQANVEAWKRRSIAGLAGPKWTRGEMEKPLGTEIRDGYTAHIYTPDQQRRLGVDKYGNKK